MRKKSFVSPVGRSQSTYVERISNGKIGYVHIPDMSSNSLSQLYIDLDVENQSKEGVVVDIRNNNGGFINPYVIGVLSRRGYLTMKERGLWNVPSRTALGQRARERPTVLVTNQHSLSDAEDLTEGYRALITRKSRRRTDRRMDYFHLERQSV